ncbi:carboxypeptidase C (cathepsin A)/predicted nucleic acid-binding Zn-ribbon protein [Phyllobacterium sp. 1468]|uniref:S10 family serine carboxypeptidase-like protein n=1 Tax=Phyllobacterium sp. 1468 TaxID=2817759 RepID=UPI002861FB59|nr:hypothetical protein [Phyllobacterium sp. 1468]MDR6632722.1 carboxypeptidase C (cathepsin A)/predicted nucleic acid-binding Zn-ribbon protein [Phyllobacterium sp. 1468]
MNFRYLLLAAALGLSACNGSDSSTKNNETEGTFSDLANAKAELVKVNAQKDAGEKDVAALEARQKELRSAIGSATAELDRLQGGDGKGGEISAQKARLAELAKEAEGKAAEIKTAKETLARLGSLEDKSGEIGLAKAAYDKLVLDAAATVEELKKATEKLTRLAGEESDGGEGGEIKAAKERLADLQSKIDDANNKLKSAQDSLEILNGKGEGSIFAAQEKLKKLTGDGADPGEIAKATKERDDLQEAARKANDDLVAARQKLATLQGDDGKGGEIADAERKLLDVTKEIKTTGEMLKAAREALNKLQGENGDGGDIAAARKTLETLSDEILTAQDKLAAAQEAWKKLAGEDGKGGDIAAEQKKLDDLIKLAADKAEEIKKAGLELERIKLDGKAITDEATLDAARIRSEALFDAGRYVEAANLLKKVGLASEAASLIDKAAGLLTAAGKLEEAYMLYAPDNHPIEDSNPYGDDPNGSVAFDKVDETPSVKRHSMQLGGKTVWFTAKAGHLIAYGQKDKNNPDAKRDPQAAVFYMSYTRDDLPKEGRPVTFFFNGGPGESSIWLHLGAWAPWRLKVDAPNVPADASAHAPESYPFIGNPETLLDKSDLVFVDPVGTGYSQAISSDVKNHINKDFWGVDADAKVMRDFITGYINANNRQSSPKYLYGESYGGGIRVPVLTRLLADAGTTGFEEDKSGKPPVVLTGSILHSPILNYATNCRAGDTSASCAGFLPTYILTGAYFEESDTRTMADRADEARTFTKTKHIPAIAQFRSGSTGWDAFKTTEDGKAYLSEIARLTHVSAVEIPSLNPKKVVDKIKNYWAVYPNMDIGRVEPDRKGALGYMNFLKPGMSYNIYDTRMLVQGAVKYDFEYSEDIAFKAEMATFLPDYLNYKNNARYVASAELTSSNWSWDWGSNRGGGAKITAETLSDLGLAINYAPELKLMVTHGYFDAATPFFQTELDLDKVVKVNGADVKLSDRIPVHDFEGGHMIYYVEKERPALKKTMDDFYDAPPYTPPAVPPVQKSAALQ